MKVRIYYIKINSAIYIFSIIFYGEKRLLLKLEFEVGTLGATVC